MIEYRWSFSEHRLILVTDAKSSIQCSDGNYYNIKIAGVIFRYVSVRNGKIHSNTGPAVISDIGEFYWEGKRISFEGWISRAKILEEDKMILILKYGGKQYFYKDCVEI